MTGRFYWVDALRGLAAMAICVFHYHHFYLANAFDRDALPPTESYPYGDVLAPLYSPAAAHAVELFWLISGFVFAHVYFHRSTGWWAFGVARFARLYPLHFATLLYVAGLQLVSLNVVGHWQIYGSNDLRHFLLQLVMASNWTTLSRGLSFNGPIWSVSMEIVVYGMFFVSLFFIRRRPVVLSGALCVASWALFWLQSSYGPVPLISRVVFECAGFFFMGTCLYSLRPQNAPWRSLGLAALGAGVAALGLVYGLDRVVIAGSSVCLVALAAGLDQMAPALGKRLSGLGDISYSLYLVHVPLQMTVLLVADMAFDGTRSFADQPLTLPIYLGVSVLLAHMAYRFFERPVGRALRQKLVREQG